MIIFSLIIMTILSFEFGNLHDNWFPFVLMIIIWFLLLIYNLYYLETQSLYTTGDQKGGNNGDNDGPKDNDGGFSSIEPIILSDIKVEINYNRIDDFNNQRIININFKDDKKEDLKYKPNEKILIKRKEVRDYMYNQNRHGSSFDNILLPKTRHKDHKEVYYEMDKSFKNK